MSDLHLFPVEASAFARSYDALFYFMLTLTGAVALAVFAVAIVFMFRYYHKRKMPRPGVATRKYIIEFSWIGIPLLLFIAVFSWAASLYADLFFPPADAMPIYVTGKQWMWRVQHAGGRREYNELHVPTGRPVVLILASEDVIHSFFVPALRLKRDVVPGRYARIWFQADRPGTYDLLCAEYCGTHHARMAGKMMVLSPDRFAKWLAAGEGEPLARAGEALFRRHGCSGCHGANATVRAPPLAGVFGRPVALGDGTTIIADEQYLRDAMLFPRRQVVAGYDPVMPSYNRLLNEDEILKLVAYIKSLAAESGT